MLDTNADNIYIRLVRTQNHECSAMSNCTEKNMFYDRICERDYCYELFRRVINSFGAGNGSTGELNNPGVGRGF